MSFVVSKTSDKAIIGSMHYVDVTEKDLLPTTRRFVRTKNGAVINIDTFLKNGIDSFIKSGNKINEIKDNVLIKDGYLSKELKYPEEKVLSENFIKLIQGEKAEGPIVIMHEGSIIELEPKLFALYEEINCENYYKRSVFSTDAQTYVAEEDYLPTAARNCTNEIEKFLTNSKPSEFKTQSAISGRTSFKTGYHIIKTQDGKYYEGREVRFIDGKIILEPKDKKDIKNQTPIGEYIVQPPSLNFSDISFTTVKKVTDTMFEYDIIVGEKTGKIKVDYFKGKPQSLQIEIAGEKFAFAERFIHTPEFYKIQDINFTVDKTRNKLSFSVFEPISNVNKKEHSFFLKKGDSLENLQIRSPYDQYKRVGIKQLLNGHIIPEIKTNYSIKGCEFYSYCALYDRTVGLDASKRLPQADIIKTGVGENGEITVVNLEAENEILKCAKQIEDLSKEFNTIEKYIFEIVQLKKRYEKEKDLKKKKELLLKIQDKNKKLAEEVDKLDDKKKAEVFAKIKDGKFVDKKKSGIKTLEENIAKLKTSNKTLQSVVDESRKNVYENAKFFNEQNRCLTIQGKEPHEITSLMPYNLSDEIGLKKIIGKDKIDNKKGKAYVNFSGKASDIAYKSLEFANVMLGATFIFPLTILAAPLCIGGFVAAAGTVAYEMVRKNIKQYRINHLTPQKIKNETNKEIENTIKSEITKAKKEMKEALKTARQNISDLTELKEAENKIYKVYKSKCLENVHQLKLLNDQIIDSPYNSAKDKKIDVKNLLGFAQAKFEKRNIKHGEKFNKDINAYNEYLRKRKECKEKIEKEENILKFAKDKQTKININNRIKAYKADYESLKHQYLAEHGPLDKRISHLKSTKEYKLLSKTEKEEKLKAKQTEVDDLKKGVKVEKVSVKGLNDDKITQKAYDLLSFANKGVDKEAMPMPELEEKKQLSISEKENKKLLIAEKLKKVAQEIFKREEGKIHISVDGQCLDETGDKTVEELAEDIIKRAYGNIKAREELLKAVEKLKGSEVSSLAEVVKVVGKMIYTGKRDLGLPLEEKKSATILDVPRKIIDKLKPKSSKSSNGRTA